MPDATLVNVGGAPQGRIGNVICLGKVPDAELRWLYRHARALISVSKEDFGLTPIEANAFGTPSLVLRAGGFLDSTHEHVSGEFIEEASVAAIIAAVRKFPLLWDRNAIKTHAERFSPDRFRDAIVNAIEASS
jgi:glycosyltransferase involved in cell wall biosynthesis